ncbi:MAG: TonB-dependent receptor plug domain-containing protein, partial [Novosphingobium sp.]
MRKARFLAISSSVLALSGGIGMSAPVMAQGAPPEAQAPDEAEGDIIVTARRREERLVDVPVAVTSFSGQQLEMAGSADITDLAQTAPNVTLEPSRGTNSTLSAFIRGVGQQ